MEMGCSSLVYCVMLRGFHPRKGIKWEGEYMLACNPSLLESEFVLSYTGSQELLLLRPTWETWEYGGRVSH